MFPDALDNAFSVLLLLVKVVILLREFKHVVGQKGRLRRLTPIGN